MNELQARIVANIRRLMREQAMFPEMLCKRAGINSGNFSKFMSEQRGLTLASMEKLSKALRVDVGELVARIAVKPSTRPK